MLTTEKFIEAVGFFGEKGQAEAWTEALNLTFDKYKVTNRHRQGMFLAQYGHETSGFFKLTENMKYGWDRLRVVFPKHFPTDDMAKQYGAPFKNGSVIGEARIANRVYGGRMGNGPEPGGDPVNGDGYKFRGRGLCHLTGRSNYNTCGKALGVNLLIDPGKLLETTWACLAGGWFWDSRNLNSVADVVKDDPDEMARVFNLDMAKMEFNTEAFGILVDKAMTAMDIRKTALGLAATPTPEEIFGNDSEEEAKDLETVTKIINGGTNGLLDRRKRYQKALAVLA